MKLYKELQRQVLEIIKEHENIGCPESFSFDQSFKLAKEELLNPSETILVPTWDRFNQAVGGLRVKEFSILCGTSGTGKTCWLANLSSNLLSSGVKQFVASVETGYVDYNLRVMSALSQKNYNTGNKFSKDEIELLEKNFSVIIKNNGIYLAPYITKISPMKIMCDLLYHYQEHQCKVAILDNLNFFMPVVSSENPNSVMDKVIHDFVIFVKNIPMHIILVMHPRKLFKGETRVESLDDIKGSSTAVQEAHNVFFFNRPKKEDLDLGYDTGSFRDLYFAKIRRRGGYVGKRIMYKNIESSYMEMAIL